MFAPPPLPRTLKASIRDLSSARPAMRASAVKDLARHASREIDTRERALPLLARALEDEAPPVRSAAAVALGDLDAKEVLPALLVAIEDADVHVRQMALNALGEIGDARATPRLRRALADARPEVRYQALIALTRVIKDDADDALSVLAAALRDADESIRYIALRIAEERRDARLPARSDALARGAAALLAKPPQHVALAAAIYLLKLGDDAEARALVLRVIRGEVRTGNGPEKEDEREAVEVAGIVGMKEAIPALERRTWGLAHFVKDTCPWHAKIALARMGHARARDEITRDLESSKKDAREAAIVAAGRARLEAARERIASFDADAADPDLVATALRELGAEDP